MAEPGASERREWVSLRCASDRFDIDRGRVRCHCTAAEFAATTNADIVVVVPAAASGRASPMVAHAAVAPAAGGGHRSVEIAVRRASVRCARPYRFAYVDGRRHAVMAVSAPFAFHHRRGPCDCDSYAGGGGDDSRAARRETTVAPGPDVRAIVLSLTDARFRAPRCPACNVPADYRRVMRHLTASADRLHRVATDVDTECTKQTERLNKCNALLEHHRVKTNILNAEMEDGLRFTDGLISSLLKNRKAIFWTGNKMIFLKIEKTREIEMSANQRFMHSIIHSQNQMIDNLTATYKEILIMINTMQLFA